MSAHACAHTPAEQSPVQQSELREHELPAATHPPPAVPTQMWFAQAPLQQSEFRVHMPLMFVQRHVSLMQFPEQQSALPVHSPEYEREQNWPTCWHMHVPATHPWPEQHERLLVQDCPKYGVEQVHVPRHSPWQQSSSRVQYSTELSRTHWQVLFIQPPVPQQYESLMHEVPTVGHAHTE